MRPAPHPLEADLSAYLDGELPAERRQRVEAWLAESEEARRRLAELRAVSDRLAALPRLQAPDALTAALARAAEQRQLFGEDASTRRLRIYQATARVLSAAAVLLVAVGIGYYYLGLLRPETGRIVEPSERPALMGNATLPRSEVPVPAAAPSDDRMTKAENIPTLPENTRTPAVFADVAVAGAGGEGSETPAVSDAVGLPTWHGLAQDTRAAGTGRAVIDVTITPTSAVEYAATVAVLNDWENRGLAAPTEGGEPVARQIASAGGTVATSVEQVYDVEAGDLSYRLNQLALSAPQQVFVQMNFVAAPDDILSQVAGIPPDATRHMLFSIHGGFLSDETQRRAALEIARSESPPGPLAPAPTETATSPAPPASNADKEPDRARGAGAPVGGPPAAGTPPPPTADHPAGAVAVLGGRTDAPRPAEALGAVGLLRPPEKTPPPAAEPTPVAQAPSAPPGAPEAARDTDRVTDAASRPAGARGAITSSSVAELETRSTQRLLNLVLRGQQPVGADAGRMQNRGQLPGNRANVASQNVLFRVRVLPPLGAEAATAAAGAAAVGPPVELANPTTMPGTEALGPDGSPEPGPPAEPR